MCSTDTRDLRAYEPCNANTIDDACHHTLQTPSTHGEHGSLKYKLATTGFIQVAPISVISSYPNCSGLTKHAHTTSTLMSPKLPTLMASQRYYHATGPSQSKRVSDFVKHAATAHEPNDNGPMLLRSPCEMPLRNLCCQTRQQPFGPAITSGTLIIQLKSLRSPAW